MGADPPSNFHVSTLPSACQSAPTGATCIAASVDYLNQARASLGQPPYTLPADFASLTPPEQLLILTDSDRGLYGLPPVPGLTDTLDQDAAAGVVADADPTPSDPDWWAYTSNWAGGYANAVLAYEAWMYDDGPGSSNYDCTPSNSSGCWGHRHDILWSFDQGGPLAMGAAAGTDAQGNRGYAMLLEEASPSAQPVYIYTWSQSGVAASVGSAPRPVPGATLTPGSHDPGSSPRAGLALQIIAVRKRAHRILITLSGRSTGYCSLVGLGARMHRVRRGKRCAHRVSFGHLPSGRYRLRVSSAGAIVARRIAVP